MTSTLANGRFYGVVHRSRSLDGSTLAETGYGPGSAVEMHVHDHPLCCLVLGGMFVERRDRGGDDIRQGELLFHPSGAAHGHRFPAAARMFTVQFGTAWLADMDEQGMHLPSAPAVMRGSAASLHAARLYYEAHRTDAASALAADEAMTALVAELGRWRASAERSAPGWMTRVIDALHAPAASPRLRDLARIADVHPAHLARTFRVRHGCAAGEYLRRIRIARAAGAVAEGRRPLSEIALEAGFCDQAHFTREFTRRIGVPPGRFRRAARR